MKNKFLAKGVKLSALLAVLTATGCAEYHRMILEDTPVCGPEFTRTLAKEYEDLGKIEHTIMYDDWSANYYYCKAIYARRGFLVNPVSLCKWDIEEDKLEELATARERLMHVLELGTWQIAPKITAYAQTNFDCWVEQQAEGWQVDDIANCRTGFYHYIAEVEHVLKGEGEGEGKEKSKKVSESESKSAPERVGKAKRAGKESALERR